MKRWLVLITLALSQSIAFAQVNIVATTSSMGMLARTVGGSDVSVTELALPDRDAHTLQVRPSMMQALRRAQLVVAVGAELEQGWLAPALEGAANSQIQPTTQGYFEAAAQVPLLDVKGTAGANRAQGDVHPLGNPHIQLDPVRMADVALALADRLSKLDATHAAAYKSRATTFKQAIDSHMASWQQLATGSSGVLLYHHDGNYLLSRFAIPSLGYIEPLAGVPPTASHILSLVQSLRGKQGVIIHTVFQGNAGIQQLANQLTWQETALALDPPSNSNQDAYFALIQQWLMACKVRKS